MQAASRANGVHGWVMALATTMAGGLSGVMRCMSLGVAGMLALLAMPASGATRGTPDPLPGFPSCDYSKWKLVKTIPMGSDTLPTTAAWTPDGNRFALAGKIYDAKTGQVIDRIKFPGNVMLPAWTADGRTVVFSSDYGNTLAPAWGEGVGTSLWAYDVATQTSSRLTDGVDGGSSSGPALSHHGARLTWTQSGISGKTRWVMLVADLIRKPDGSARLGPAQTLAPDDPSDPAYGAWQRVFGFTADDSGVIVESTRGGAGNDDIWRIDLRTRRWTNLTNSPYWEENPGISPNGQKISYVSTRDYPWPGNAAGAVFGMSGFPASFDNILIVAYLPFAAEPVYGMSAEEYIANPDGTGQQSITFNTDLGIQGGWYSGWGGFSPDGTKLAFTQVAVTQVRVPGMPPNLVQYRDVYTNRVTGGERWYRLLIVEFSCTHPGANTTRAALSLRVRRVRGRIRATVLGRDVRLVRRIEFFAGRRLVARDDRPPFTTLLTPGRAGRAGRPKIRARAILNDGRGLTLRSRT